MRPFAWELQHVEIFLLLRLSQLFDRFNRINISTGGKYEFLVIKGIVHNIT